MLYVDLKRLRSDNSGMTQEELARRVGCRQSFISQIESGTRRPTQEILARLKEEFGDIDCYISDTTPDNEIVQHNNVGDNIVGDKITLNGGDAEIIRLKAMLEQARNEITWLRGMVEKLSKCD